MTENKRSGVKIGRECSPKNGNERTCFPKGVEWKGGSCATVTSKILTSPLKCFQNMRFPEDLGEGWRLELLCMAHWASTVLSPRAEHGMDAP